ncbi:hypothetical protein [Novosphingobium guangzhouense]|uniref:Uncharacterized protein n=1 Tax=Novosphingobium guangzhouense TaxID=1850347 RepID=A0A2K2FSL3_9SPHN|nr:hypothetical protein [Novosphingobium guangzhouense]PNU01758.1 hypothetical protein A8V01_11905 [Novosphingobium guangzhouense]
MSDERSGRESAEKLTREERLAAKLRENLRRRKAQARAVSQAVSSAALPDRDGESSGSKPPLAKSPPES